MAFALSALRWACTGLKPRSLAIVGNFSGFLNELAVKNVPKMDQTGEESSI
jgi:hypothetical protein